MELTSPVLALEPIFHVLGEERIVPFAILLVVILVIPILFERLRLPGLVGLVGTGILLGPSGWNLFEPDGPMLTLLSEIGLVYLMFVAGLEVDIEQFWQHKNRSLGFGTFSFSVPLLLGTFFGGIMGWRWNTAILIGSLFASQSLLAYPIISRLGVINNEAVTATIGGTVFTDLGALLILAVCAAAQAEVFSLPGLLSLLGCLTIYGCIVLLGFDWAGKEFFRRSGDDEGNQFIFVLLSVFIAAAVAKIIGVERIFGAFLAGLAVNETLSAGPLKEKVVFVGNLLFIPIFFVDLGLLVNLPTFVYSTGTIKLTLLMIIGVIVSKLIAALLTKLVYRYNWTEMLTIWSVSLPQIGTTLGITLVGFRSGLLPPEVLNSVIILMITTATLGPMITSWVAAGLSTSVRPTLTPVLQNRTFTVVVPINNTQTQQYLMEMAALLVRQANGKLIPLAIATATAQMDAPQLEASWQQSERLLAKATDQIQGLGVTTAPLLRIDNALAQGISRATREQKASLIVMGWGNRTGLWARLFGNVIDSVLWSTHCPVAVARLVESPKKIQRILVPMEDLTTSVLGPVQFAQMLAETNQSHITVLNVCDRRISASKITARRLHLSQLVSQSALPNLPEIQIIPHENSAQAILQAARLYDLVVLPLNRNPTNHRGLAISDVTTHLARELTCSIVMLGEPQRTGISQVRVIT